MGKDRHTRRGCKDRPSQSPRPLGRNLAFPQPHVGAALGAAILCCFLKNEHALLPRRLVRHQGNVPLCCFALPAGMRKAPAITVFPSLSSSPVPASARAPEMMAHVKCHGHGVVNVLEHRCAQQCKEHPWGEEDRRP